MANTSTKNTPTGYGIKIIVAGYIITDVQMDGKKPPSDKLPFTIASQDPMCYIYHMQSEKPNWNHYFTIQISKPRKWVRWDYVSDGGTARPLRIQPKRVWLGGKVEQYGFWHEFELPKSWAPDVIPTVCDEVESWGWRMYAYDSPQSNGNFTLVGGIEEALAQAKEKCKRDGLIPEGITLIGEDGSREEIPMDEDMAQFAEKCKAAVESWRAGNGWPNGWKGKMS